MKAGSAPGNAESHPVPEATGQGGGDHPIDGEIAETVESLFYPFPLPEQLRRVFEVLKGTPSAFAVEWTERFLAFVTGGEDSDKLCIEVSFSGGGHTGPYCLPREGSPDENHRSVILHGDSADTVPQCGDLQCQAAVGVSMHRN